MDEKSIEILEFPVIRRILSGFTSFSASRQLALELMPLTEYEVISRRLKETAEARHLLAVEPGITVGSTTDIREEVRLAALGKILDPSRLLEIRWTLAALRHLHDGLEKLSGQFPLLWDIGSGIVPLPSVEKSIASCLAENGDILDEASTRLAAIRCDLNAVHRQVWDALESLMKTTRGQQIIQEPIITEREGRYVVPVKTEYRRELGGIVHDVSNTGATAFIEPWTTVEMGNTLRELRAEEKQEIERILSRLSSEAGVYEDEIRQNVVLAAELDLALARAKFAARFRATEPELIQFGGENGVSENRKPVVRLVEARHPLLADKAVPVSVELGKDFSVLVITGPNTGGKTVALKTVGLFSLMAQAGLPVPASAGSCLPVFDGIYADIGDEQSIEQTLSSFSWHIGNINRIVNKATPRSLVLLDELGTSTDPEEGSALAHSILLHFLRQKTLTIATTHFSALKVFAHATPGMENASFEFDPVTFVPTYHLSIGIPGGSNALATASRLGLLPDIVNEARGMLSEGARDLETLLTGLMEEKQKTEAARQHLEEVSTELEKERREAESLRCKLKDAESSIINQFRDRVVLETNNLHQEIKQAVAALRKERSREKVERARQVLFRVREQLRDDVWMPPENEAEKEKVPLTPGDIVRVNETSAPATVLSVSEEKQQVEVQVGPARLRVGLQGVEKMAPETGFRNGQPGRMGLPSGGHVSPELDLRGKRTDDVDALLDSYLNGATIAGLNEVRIIHGIGTGAVRRVVRDILATHPLVKSFRSGSRDEGHDGASIVSLQTL